MPDAPYITKGTHILAQWFQSKPLGTFSLAGVQMKTTGSFVEISGTCRHFRGDDPTNPKEIRIYVEPGGDINPSIQRTRPFGCACPGHDNLVEIKPDWILEVLP